MSSDTQFVIHVKTREGGFQITKPCIVCTYIDVGESGLYAKCLDKRKVQYCFLAKRPAQQEETNTEKNKYRVHFMLYSNWETLIADEAMFTSDKNWFDQLLTLQAKFPQFKKTDSLL